MSGGSSCTCSLVPCPRDPHPFVPLVSMTAVATNKTLGEMPAKAPSCDPPVALVIKHAKQLEAAFKSRTIRKVLTELLQNISKWEQEAAVPLVHNPCQVVIVTTNALAGALRGHRPLPRVYR